MSKKVLIGLGILGAVIAVLFATEVVQVVSVEEGFHRQQKQEKRIAELETKMSASVDRASGSMIAEDIASLAVNDKVSQDDLDKIRILVEDGQYQKALDAHLWFHEQSKSSPAMGGVRLSFALSSWLELGKKYPSALDALKAVRDKDKELLLSGTGDFSNFHDFSAINQTLGLNQQTVELFLRLDEQSSEQTEIYYIVAEALLIKAQQYDIISKYIGDPIVKYENMRYMRERSLSYANSSAASQKVFLLDSANQQYIQGVLNLLKVCLAIDKKDAALEIQKRALSYYDDDKIRDAIQ